MDKLALIAGNVFLGLAALVYFVPHQLVLAEKPGHDGGLLWGQLFVNLALFGLFGMAHSAMVWRGGLDAWGWSRAGQYVVVWGVCLALAAASFCAGVFRFEPLQQVPWVIRLMLGWGTYVLPLLLLATGLLSLNDIAPAMYVRWALAAVGGFGFLLGVLLLGEGFLAVLRNQEQQMAGRQAYHDRRDQMMLADVENADAVEGFGRLLPHTSRWETEGIREIALAKVRSVPDLPALLRVHLRNGYYADALTFLRDNEVGDPATLAEAVRDAIGMATRRLRERVEANRDLWRDDLASEVEKVQQVAGKYGRYGVDLQAALREYEVLAAQARTLAR